jgi:RND family efflux transporter MFP subunit
MVSARLRNGFWAMVVLLAGSGLSYVLLTSKSGPEPREMPAATAPVVEVIAVTPRTRALEVSTQGTVQPRREIKLVSRVGGRVEAVAPGFAQGGFVAAGEQLVKLEEVDYRFVIARAQSQVAAARQVLAEEEGRALQSRREWRDLGSEQGNALFLRKPQLAAAQAAVSAAEADLAAAQLDLERTSLRAPFNGRIYEKFVDVGQFVAPGTVVAGLYDTDVVEVRLPLTDRQVALLDLPLYYANDSAQDAAAGAPVVLRARFAGREWEWQGSIVRTDASIDVDSRVVYAVAEVNKPFMRVPDSDRPPLAPGLFVSATISGRSLEQLSRLPRSALHSDETVMIVDAQQRARVRPVRVLQSSAQEVWVQGLQRGERVIISQPGIAVAGMQVTVRELGELADGGR